MKIVVLKFLLYFILFFVISDWNSRKPEISAYWSIRITKQTVAIFPSQKLIITDLVTYGCVLQLPCLMTYVRATFFWALQEDPTETCKPPACVPHFSPYAIWESLFWSSNLLILDQICFILYVTFLQVYLGASQTHTTAYLWNTDLSLLASVFSSNSLS